jgi:hypothetical protein
MGHFAATGNPEVDIPGLIRFQGDGLTFIELLRFLPYLKGDFSYWTGNENIFLWDGLSEQCIGILAALLRANKISIEPASQRTYLMDGGGLRLPLVKANRKYKKPHWLPVTFSVVSDKMTMAA